MRILISSGGDATETVSAAAMAAGEHQLVIVHPGGIDAPLELALRNALPGHEVATVAMQVVVDGDDPAQPRAISELRSVRALLELGTVVVCAIGALTPVVVGSAGKLEAVEAEVDADRVTELLAKRLDAHRLVSARRLIEELGYARHG
jgi:carbamate kinase